MKIKSLVFILAAALVFGAAPFAVADEGIATRYRSQPDQAVLYLGDLAYVRDTVTLPPGEVEVTFPPQTIADTLIVTENSARVPVLRFRGRIAPDMEAMLSSRAAPTSEEVAGRLAVSWPSEATEPREVVLEYLMRGAGWRPVYDMTVIDEESAHFTFAAEITNYALTLEDAEVRLVSGLIMSGEMGVYTAEMTVAQNVLGYENVPAGGEMPAAEQVSAHHVYTLGTLSIMPGDVVRTTLASETLGARRIIAWDTQQGERTDVIYKVANTSNVPFAEGMVRTYQDGIYMGSDAIEWTPVGSEGSVTVAGMSDVRVRRGETVEEIGDMLRVDRYHYQIELEIGNYSGEDIEITVIDRWPRDAVDFRFSQEPDFQPNNVLRWDVTVPAGERVTINYEYYTD